MTATTCTHEHREEGVCVACGDCLHEVVLNGACFLCGTTDLEVIMRKASTGASTGAAEGLIAPDALIRKK